MKKVLNRKIVIPVVSAFTVLSLAMPAFAWTSVTASASITFSESQTYYRATAKSSVKGNGSSNEYQRIENYTVFQSDASWMDFGSTRGNSSPVTVTLTSDKEGDDLTWKCTVDGSLWEGGLLHEHSDSVTKKYTFRNR
ncbi:hypothetical protein ACQKK5_26200 [Brevibacillus panacihumi]|uniref:hypothetical protein n=1 Tax=Brevibacillus panacihumi TaxID=497735 RepID=UPI003D042CFD